MEKGKHQGPLGTEKADFSIGSAMAGAADQPQALPVLVQPHERLPGVVAPPAGGEKGGNPLEPILSPTRRKERLEQGVQARIRSYAADPDGFFARAAQNRYFLADIFFEVSLDQRGVIGNLEAQGFLPAIHILNPFDHDTEEAQHDAWWAAHPDEGERFIQDVSRRDMILQYIHFGTVVGQILGDTAYTVLQNTQDLEAAMKDDVSVAAILEKSGIQERLEQPGILPADEEGQRLALTAIFIGAFLDRLFPKERPSSEETAP